MFLRSCVVSAPVVPMQPELMSAIMKLVPMRLQEGEAQIIEELHEEILEDFMKSMRKSMGK